MSLDEGNPSYRTATGACFSILVLLITMTFTCQNSLILVGRKATQFTTNVMQNYHDDTYEFSTEQGFALAYAIINDTPEEALDDLLEVSIQQVARYGSNLIPDKKIETHSCTEEELGILEGQTDYPMFYRPADTWT